jgi:hypothetical protein
MTHVIPRDRAYFQARSTVDANRCWVWALQSATAGHGRGGPYGRTRCPVERRPIGAHVAAYKFLTGPIPTGYEIDHTCRNTLCVNPDHLEAVTRTENNRRRAAAGDATNQNTSKTHCPKCGERYSGESTRGDGRTFRFCVPCTKTRQAAYFQARKAKKGRQ